jgi:hypothetical protein
MVATKYLTVLSGKYPAHLYRIPDSAGCLNFTGYRIPVSGSGTSLIKMLREMRIKDVCFVNCDFALFISIYFIIVIINMIRDNQIYMISLDCTRVKT